MELMKIGIFSKDVKKANAFYHDHRSLRLVARPTIRWHWENRFSPEKTNRSFKKDWYKKYRTLENLPREKKHRVLCGRPVGPGPLVKLTKAWRRMATGRHAAEAHKRAHKPVVGPTPPLHVERWQAPPARTGKTDRKRQREQDEKVLKRLPRVGRAWMGLNGLYVSYHGGKTFVTPPDVEHKKYWYFKRKRGYWTFSQHHPYGDEIDVYRDIRL